MSTPRLTVRLFAEVMEEKLRQNDYKGGWGNTAPGDLLLRLEQEAQELRDAIEMCDASAIRREAADVANFAMMVADVCGGLSEHDAGGKEKGR